jgi:hypothetical protein
MLYPTELSSGGRTGFEPVTIGMKPMLFQLSYRPLTAHCVYPRHTPRQRRAHRTGEASATNPCRCGCSADVPCIDAYGRRPAGVNPLCECIRVPPVPKHPGTAHQRFTAFPASKPACSGCFGIARCNRVVIVWSTFANARKENAPGLRTRGRSRSSGGRVTDLPCAGDQSQWPCSSRARRPQPVGLRASCWAMGKKMFMALRRSKSVRDCEGRARYAFVNSNARPFVGKRAVDVRHELAISDCECAQRSSGSSCVHTWSRSFGCAVATGCRLSSWNALRSSAIGSSRNGSSATPCCLANAA